MDFFHNGNKVSYIAAICITESNINFLYHNINLFCYCIPEMRGSRFDEFTRGFYYSAVLFE